MLKLITTCYGDDITKFHFPCNNYYYFFGDFNYVKHGLGPIVTTYWLFIKNVRKMNPLV